MRRLLLAILRVPERPEPPPGSAGSLQVFRASRRYLGYSVLRWGLKQIGALFGILVSLGLLGRVDFLVHFEGLEQLVERAEDVHIDIGFLLFRTEMTLLELFEMFERLAIGGFLVQLLISGTLLRLSWEMRWYLVSDTSLRIRHGLLRLREQTMTIANLQEVRIQQGLVQRLFGIADLEVRTAGGGGKAEGSDAESQAKDLHVGRLRGLEDPWSLRDQLRRSLARHRDAGLGDDDARRLPGGPAVGVPDELGRRLVDAVAAMVEESRGLRRRLEEGAVEG